MLQTHSIFGKSNVSPRTMLNWLKRLMKQAALKSLETSLEKKENQIGLAHVRQTNKVIQGRPKDVGVIALNGPEKLYLNIVRPDLKGGLLSK